VTMAELIGRAKIAEHLGVTCGEVSRLIRRGLPVRFDRRRMIADSKQIDEWKKKKAL
jgi:hypothetical protein